MPGLDAGQVENIVNQFQKMAAGNVDPVEMYRTFNCGVGMVIVVPAEQAQSAIDLLTAEGENAFLVGNIAAANADEEQIELQGL